jgi:proton glutamate symport protein
MSLTTRVLIALIAGLAVGLLIASSGSPQLAALGRAVEPLGTLFVNGIRMTIIPLVVSSLIVGIAAAPDAATIGRLGGRSLLFMLVAVSVAALIGVTLAGPIFARFPIDAAATAALRASAGDAAASAAASAQKLPSIGQWLTELVPINPIKAAADGAMLPLIVFTVAFGIAFTRIAPSKRDALLPVLEAIQDTSLTLVRWVLTLAPLGVFGLAVPLATRLGINAVGALASYIGVVSALSLLLILLCYPVATVFGRLPLATFARATLPPQAMAFSGRSSLAALPAMITATRDTLGLPPQIPGFLVPLLTSTFRVGAGIGQTVAVVFMAHLYGIALTPAQLVTIAVTTVISSFAVPGIPGGTIVGMVPVMMVAGIPIEGAGILLGVDTIPDMFRTTANVTGDMTAAVVLGARERVASER